ncbi:MAG TPA: hypothetical protein PK239_14740 [Chitinophagales bacterium]|nr:hypothetical protein [Chitinophagales bacterium]HRK28531.1 hypothetical protein [Chitinophagales bacterium]
MKPKFFTLILLAAVAAAFAMLVVCRQNETLKKRVEILETRLNPTQTTLQNENPD